MKRARQAFRFSDTARTTCPRYTIAKRKKKQKKQKKSPLDVRTASINVFSHTSIFQLLDKSWSQVSSLLPPGSLPSLLIAHRVQQSHCSSIFHRVLLTYALALSASQFVHKKKSPRINTSAHSGGFELTKLTYTNRLEDNLIRHRGDRLLYACTTFGLFMFFSGVFFHSRVTVAPVV